MSKEQWFREYERQLNERLAAAPPKKEKKIETPKEVK